MVNEFWRVGMLTLHRILEQGGNAKVSKSYVSYLLTATGHILYHLQCRSLHGDLNCDKLR